MKATRVVIAIVLGALAYVVGTVIMGILSPALHLPAMKAIPGSTPQKLFLMLVASSFLLILGLIPLAAGLRGSWISRWAALAGLLYVTLGLNTLIEAKIFSDVLQGNPWLASLQWVLPCALVSIVLASYFGESPTTKPHNNSGPVGWAWRLCLAWLAFPVIYFFFGMCVAPIVVPYYNAHDVLGLRIPGFNVIIPTQLLRSAILLAVSLPSAMLWAKSRKHFFFALGLAQAMTIGIFQLAQAYFMPLTLRIAHGAEITADAFAYAGVLTWLFTRKAESAQPQLKTTSAAAD
jgi:hypothetical protein